MEFEGNSFISAGALIFAVVTAILATIISFIFNNKQNKKTKTKRTLAHKNTPNDDEKLLSDEYGYDIINDIGEGHEEDSKTKNQFPRIFSTKNKVSFNPLVEVKYIEKTGNRKVPIRTKRSAP